LRGLRRWVQPGTWGPHKLRCSNSILNLCCKPNIGGLQHRLNMPPAPLRGLHNSSSYAAFLFLKQRHAFFCSCPLISICSSQISLPVMFHKLPFPFLLHKASFSCKCEVLNFIRPLCSPLLPRNLFRFMGTPRQPLIYYIILNIISNLTGLHNPFFSYHELASLFTSIVSVPKVSIAF